LRDSEGNLKCKVEEMQTSLINEEIGMKRKTRGFNPKYNTIEEASIELNTRNRKKTSVTKLSVSFQKQPYTED